MGCGTPNGGHSVGQLACHNLDLLDCTKLSAANGRMRETCEMHKWRSRLYGILQPLVRDPQRPMSLAAACLKAVSDSHVNGSEPLSAPLSVADQLATWSGCLAGALDGLKKAVLDATFAQALQLSNSPTVISALCKAHWRSPSDAAGMGASTVTVATGSSWDERALSRLVLEKAYAPGGAGHERARAEFEGAAQAAAERFAASCSREVAELLSRIV